MSGFFLLVGLFSCQNQDQSKLRIAVAANLQFVIKDLVEDFSERTGVPCEIIVSSSGKLTAQIIEGAPYDVFMSADMKYPEELFNKDQTHSAPDIYAYGKLILWTLNKDIHPVLETLKSDKVSYIAIGNPKTAPYGFAAMEVIRGSGLEEVLKNKLVYGESIAQTNQFIISESVDLGFTSKSVVMSSQMKDKGVWTDIDKDLYSPLEQGMVILRSRQEFKEKAMLFQNYILSSEGKEILSKFGYDLNY